jgi:hypothetical protein
MYQSFKANCWFLILHFTCNKLSAWNYTKSLLLILWREWSKPKQQQLNLICLSLSTCSMTSTTLFHPLCAFTGSGYEETYYQVWDLHSQSLQFEHILLCTKFQYWALAELKGNNKIQRSTKTHYSVLLKVCNFDEAHSSDQPSFNHQLFLLIQGFSKLLCAIQEYSTRYCQPYKNNWWTL